MFGIGPVELVVVFVVALLVFGPKKLPELARTLGRGLAEFRRASSDLRRSMDLDINLDPSPRIRDTSLPAQTGGPDVPPRPPPRPGSSVESPPDIRPEPESSADSEVRGVPAPPPDIVEAGAAPETGEASEDEAEKDAKGG